MKRTSMLFFSFVLGVLLLSSFALAEPNFSGKWKFNEKQSDDPHKKFAEAMRQNRSGGGGGFEGHHGMHGGVGSDPGAGNWHDRGSRGERSGMFEAPVELTISYNAPVFRTIDNSGVDRSLYTDGRKNEVELPDGRKVVSTAHWEEDSLVVESEGPNGGTMTQTYELSADGKQLFVKLRIPTPFGDQAVQIIRVYDAIPPDAPTQTNQTNS